MWISKFFELPWCVNQCFLSNLGSFWPLFPSNMLSFLFFLFSPSGTPIMHILICPMVSHRSLRLCSFLFYFSDWTILTDLPSSLLTLSTSSNLLLNCSSDFSFPFQLSCFSIAKFLFLCNIFCVSLDILSLMRYLVISKELKLWDIVSFNSLNIFTAADLQPFLESLMSGVIWGQFLPISPFIV